MELLVIYIFVFVIILSFIIFSFINKEKETLDDYDITNKEKLVKQSNVIETPHKPNINLSRIIVNEDAKESQIKIDEKAILKDNWNEFKKLIDSNSIKSLYHITDASNLASINNHNFLYSWEYAIKNNIIINNPGGNQLSRDLDSRYGVQNYVRLCFTTDFPMIHIALRDGRIKQPVVLEFDPKIIYFIETKFCQINATDNNAIIGDTIEIFQNIRFDIIKRKGFIEDNNLRKFKQAEVLVLEKLSLEYLVKKPYNWR